METKNLAVLPLHKHPEFLTACCKLINEEWPRSETARMMSLKASCDNLPTSLVLVRKDKELIGHCKLTPIPSTPHSCFIETVVITKSMRGKRLGTYLMKEVEEYCKNILKMDMVHLSTKGQEHFYSKLGYVICPPVNIYGNVISNICIPTDNNVSETPVPVINSEIPVPPPMPKPQVNLNCNVKSNKTFMYKYLK